MTNARRDENFVPTLLGTLNTDGVTVIPLEADPSTHALKVSIGNSGNDNGPENAIRDANRVPCIMAVSSFDGVTPVAVYVDSDGNLLLQNTPPVDNVMLIQDSTYFLLQDSTNLLLNS